MREDFAKGQKISGELGKEDCAQSSVLYRYKYKGICAEGRKYHKRQIWSGSWQGKNI